MNSRNRAPGTLPPRGSSGGDRGTPGPTNSRALPHHRKTDLDANGSEMLSSPLPPRQFHPGWVGQKAGGELTGTTVGVCDESGLEARIRMQNQLSMLPSVLSCPFYGVPPMQ